MIGTNLIGILGIMTVLLGDSGHDWKLGELSHEFLVGLIEQSEVVVVAEVTDGLQKIGVEFEPEPLFVCGFEIKVLQAIKGNISANTILQVIGQQKFNIGLEPPQIGQTLVMFLKFGERGWINADNKAAWIKTNLSTDHQTIAQMRNLGQAIRKPQRTYTRRWFCANRKKFLWNQCH